MAPPYNLLNQLTYTVSMSAGSSTQVYASMSAPIAITKKRADPSQLLSVMWLLLRELPLQALHAFSD